MKAGLQAENELLQQVVARKKDEHAMMWSIVKDHGSQRTYLDGAPDGINYARMAAIIEAGNMSQNAILISWDFRHRNTKPPAEINMHIIAAPDGVPKSVSISL